MSFHIRMLESTEERREVQRMFYEIYVEEMGRLQDEADHENRLLVLDNFEHFRILGAFDTEETLQGFTVLTTGEDIAISEDYTQDYNLTLFQDIIPQKRFFFAENTLVRRAVRGTSIAINLIMAASDYFFKHEYPAAFIDCEPHLLNLFTRLGFRSYTEPYFEPQFGMVCPLILLPDVEHLTQLNSPLAQLPHAPTQSSEQTLALRAICEQRASLLGTQQTMSEAEWNHVYQLSIKSNDMGTSIFSDMTEEQKEVCLKNSLVLTCHQGTPIITKGNKGDQSMYLILSGSVLIQNKQGKTIAVRGEGDILGEIAFLMKVERTANVTAAVDNTRILIFNQKNIEAMIAHNSDVASRFLFNLNKLLCTKLISRMATE